MKTPPKVYYSEVKEIMFKKKKRKKRKEKNETKNSSHILQIKKYLKRIKNK